MTSSCSCWVVEPCGTPIPWCLHTSAPHPNEQGRPLSPEVVQSWVAVAPCEWRGYKLQPQKLSDKPPGHHHRAYEALGYHQEIVAESTYKHLLYALIGDIRSWLANQQYPGSTTGRSRRFIVEQGTAMWFFNHSSIPQFLVYQLIIHHSPSSTFLNDTDYYPSSAIHHNHILYYFNPPL